MKPLTCTLKTYLLTAHRGAGTDIARALGVTRPMVSQWADRSKAIPDDHAPAIERATGGQVRVETMCPNAVWVRMPDPDWPQGKPLLERSSRAAARKPKPKPTTAKQALQAAQERIKRLEDELAGRAAA
jgi:DNA-binding transcriptional regulator YdaS (Cro superfamily)